MKSREEFLKELNGNEVLLAKLEKAWRSNATDEDIAAILAEAGVTLTPDDLQALLAERQQATLRHLQAEELDDDQLSAVSGGGGEGKCSGTADCDFFFKSNPELSYDLRCSFDEMCDEAFHKRCIWTPHITLVHPYD